MNKDVVTDENKLILLYFLHHMDIPTPWTRLQEFSQEYMDYFTFQPILKEMQYNGLVESISEEDREGEFYAITNEGRRCVNYFSKRLPLSKREEVLAYIKKNGDGIKKEYDIYANYFKYDEDQYVVKCGYAENDRYLIEMNLSVFTKEQAKLVRKNWKNKVTKLYSFAIKELLTEDEEEKTEEK
ncbi:MAG: DUF4364 family protein [Firmicutes bacterium]|nr:DUF4364 family protein [Bacillota bacterium]